MFLFGHVGITIAAASLAARYAKNNRAKTREKNPWFMPLARVMDIRFLAVGSLLPDIIDKPVGQLLFRETFSNGRIFSHTLLFLIIVGAIGYFIFRNSRKTWGLALAAGTLGHLVLDQIWRTPHTMFWPVLGLQFDKIDLEGMFSRWLGALLSNPVIYISEAIGLIITVWFAAWVISRRKVGMFLRRGRTD